MNILLQLRNDSYGIFFRWRFIAQITRYTFTLRNCLIILQIKLYLILKGITNRQRSFFYSRSIIIELHVSIMIVISTYTYTYINEVELHTVTSSKTKVKVLSGLPNLYLLKMDMITITFLSDVNNLYQQCQERSHVQPQK